MAGETHWKGENTMADRVAVITGAGSGIGRASALALCKDGWSVALLRPPQGRAGGNRRPRDRRQDAGDPDRRGGSGSGGRGCSPRSRKNSAASTCCSTTPAATCHRRISATSPGRCGDGRRGEPERDVPVRQPGVPHDARPDPARRTHHQQRLDLRARAAAGSVAYTATKHASPA